MANVVTLFHPPRLIQYLTKYTNLKTKIQTFRRLSIVGFYSESALHKIPDFIS